MSIKILIQKEKIVCMKSKNKEKRNALTLVLAKIKQYEVDNRVDLENEDTIVLSLLDKMIKERKDSIKLYEEADRKDLLDKELFEIEVIQEFLPEELSKEEIKNLIDKAFETVKPESIKQMGQVMAILKPQLQGRANIGEVSGIVKGRL
jgi:uncharacterized protein YqeY